MFLTHLILCIYYFWHLFALRKSDIATTERELPLIVMHDLIVKGIRHPCGVAFCDKDKYVTNPLAPP